MKYYFVTVQRGHLGTRRSDDLKFAIEAENITTACVKAQQMPMVKHSKPISRAIEISKEEYNEFRKTSAYINIPKKKEKIKK